MRGKKTIENHLDETFNNIRYKIASLNYEIKTLQTQYLYAVKHKLDMEEVNSNVKYISSNFKKVNKALNLIKKMFKK